MDVTLEELYSGAKIELEMNKQRICPHCRSHPTLELSPRALTHQNKAPSGLSFARGRRGVDRSVAPAARP